MSGRALLGAFALGFAVIGAAGAPANTGPGDFPGGEIRAQIIEE